MVKDTYVQIKKMLAMIDELAMIIQGFSDEEYFYRADSIEEDIRYVIETVNLALLDDRNVCFCRLDELGKGREKQGYKERMVGHVAAWKDQMTDVLDRQYHAEDIWDERFIKLMDRVRYVDSDLLIEDAKEALKKRTDKELERLCMHYQVYQEMWGTLDIVNERYDVVINRVKALKEHREDFIWLYSRLGDRHSKLVLTSMLYNWITFDPDYISGMKEANYVDYFDLDLVRCDEEEVFVDCGAWTGDSTLDYIQTYGKYKKIYCYEIDDLNMETMKKILSGYPDIEYRNKGVGNKNGMGYIASSFVTSCHKLTEYDIGKAIEVVRLDDDIHEKVTLIKMDIEGAEQDALLGCTRHIREEKPKLLISVYHNNEDIWKIPQMIIGMDPGYQLYLRSNGAQPSPAEIVLLAIYGG